MADQITVTQDGHVAVIEINRPPANYLDRTLMLFGDAKQFVGGIVRELGGGH